MKAETRARSSEPPETVADRVAERLGGSSREPWEVFGERLRRYEIHLTGAAVEMRRGPIDLEGFGVRLFRPRDGGLGVGIASSGDLSDATVERTLAAARESTAFARFPAPSVELPGPGGTASTSGAETADPDLSRDPEGRLDAFVHELLEPYERFSDVRPSFGSVRVTLGDCSVVNSEGFRGGYRETLVDLELAIKAFGGAQGAPPAEYWANPRARTLDADALGVDAERWARLARDMRRAKAPPTGQVPVLLPTDVLSDVVPPVVGFRLSGTARLRRIANEAGSRIGAESLRLEDDGTIPYALGSSPFDDEGHPRRRTVLVEGGEVRTLLYDALHAAAFDSAPTGHSQRGNPLFSHWFRFASGVGAHPSTIVLEAGDGGSDEELVEATRDGLWVDQLGWSSPDPQSGTFGGEIRAGYRIRDGRIAEPVRGGTLGGFVIGPPGEPSLLSGLVARGTTARTVGHYRAPTLRVDGLSIAGG
jgi:predicted Zn-dependent protease